MFLRRSCFIFLLLLPWACLCLRKLSLDNGLGRTPQMGWNSWNHFGCGINQTVMEETADAFISTGLYKYGYEYVNVDDCWAKSRDAAGIIQPDNSSFPDFRGMIDHIHSKGLKFGLYSDAGNKTCAGRPGSLNYEGLDALTYAMWGVDYLKYDNCNNDQLSPLIRYPKMTKALNDSGRHIFFSLCEWGQDDPADWAPNVGNSWRTTGDISDNWGRVMQNADLNNDWYSLAGPGGWNDPDMLEVGNGFMSTTEDQSHFSLWCLMKAPLLVGCDIRSMSNETFRILTNSEVIAVNQDPLGIQGTKVKSDGIRDIWAGPLADGSFAVILLNRGFTTTSITASWSDIGLPPLQKATVRDLWAHKDIGTMSGSVTASVESHGVAMYRITPAM